jgi:aspartokinase-like uncharacterized kinase
MSQSPHAPPAIRVVKVGGSLLGESRLPQLVANWHARQPVATNVLLAGGGSLVDAVRQLDRAHALGEERSHWLAVRAMSVSAALLADLLPCALLVQRFDKLVELLADDGSIPEGRLIVFDSWQFLREVEPGTPGTRLPHHWQATSDSIAARLAAAIAHGGRRLHELVLLKSTLPARGATLAEAMAAAVVDGCFQQQAAGLPCVRLVNLRSESFEDQSWPAE